MGKNGILLKINVYVLAMLFNSIQEFALFVQPLENSTLPLLNVNVCQGIQEMELFVRPLLLSLHFPQEPNFQQTICSRKDLVLEAIHDFT